MPAEDVKERKKKSSKKKKEPEPEPDVEVNPMMRFLGVGLIMAGFVLIATIAAKELMKTM